MEEGSTYRKVLELWGRWHEKWRDEYNVSNVGNEEDEGGEKKERGDARTKTKVQMKGWDPNMLAEIV